VIEPVALYFYIYDQK